MQLLFQHRQLSANLIVTGVVCALLYLIPSLLGSVFGLYLLIALPLQFCVSSRWLWGFTAPLALSLTLLVVHFLHLSTGLMDQYVIVLIAPLVILVTLLINGGVYFWQRYVIRKYAKQVNASGLIQTLYISDQLLVQSGLSDSERTFFKREIRNAYHQLEYLQEIRREVVKYIPSYDTDLKMINQIFQELLSSPKQLLKVANFMYDHLPDYVALVQGIDRMSNNVMSDDDDQTAISQAQKKLLTLSDKFKADYRLVTAHESEELKQTAK